MIRNGTEQDIEICLEMSERFWGIAGYCSDIPFDYESTREMFMGCLNSKIFSVAEREGKVVGFVAGVACPSIVNKAYLVGAELAWWMEPEYRHTSDSIKLLKHAEESAQQAGCTKWSMMCLEAVDPDKVEKIYLNMGYQPAERTFVKTLR